MLFSCLNKDPLTRVGFGVKIKDEILLGMGRFVVSLVSVVMGGKAVFMASVLLAMLAVVVDGTITLWEIVVFSVATVSGSTLVFAFWNGSSAFLA